MCTHSSPAVALPPEVLLGRGPRVVRHRDARARLRLRVSGLLERGGLALAERVHVAEPQVLQVRRVRVGGAGAAGGLLPHEVCRNGRSAVRGRPRESSWGVDRDRCGLLHEGLMRPSTMLMPRCTSQLAQSEPPTCGHTVMVGQLAAASWAPGRRARPERRRTAATESRAGRRWCGQRDSERLTVCQSIGRRSRRVEVEEAIATFFMGTRRPCWGRPSWLGGRGAARPTWRGLL